MSDIRVEIDQAVAVLTLAAPDRRNALTAGMARELIDACGGIDADASVGAVVVRAEGRAFCAGAHRELLATVARSPASDDAFRDVGLIYEAFVRVGHLRPPTVAAIRGAAVGAGLNLALATDLRIIARDAVLNPGFLRLGAHPGGGNFVLLSRVAGREATAAMGLFGQHVTGEEAQRRGIAWEALDADEVEDRAIELAHVAAADPELARRTARTFRLETGPPGTSWEVGVQAEQATQMWSFQRNRIGAADTPPEPDPST